MSERPTGDTVLLVEDDETLRQTIAMILEMEGYTILQAQSGSDAISLATRKSVQLVISDIRLPGGLDGIDLLVKLKGMLRSTPRMILMTGYADQAATVRAIRVGVDDYIHKPFEMEVLLHAVRQSLESVRLHEDVRRYQQLSIKDGLTELYNHRHFHDELAKELEVYRRTEHGFGLLLADIDHFKKINDAHGHLQGDLVLRHVAKVLERTTRTVDTVFRYGGEEFAVVLPSSDEEASTRCAERLRMSVEWNPFIGDAGDSYPVTVSLGVATCPTTSTEKTGLIARADAALYEAKRTGRNRVCVASPASLPKPRSES